MVEAMVAVTIMDALMQQKAQCELLPVVEGEGDPRPNPLGKGVEREGFEGVVEKVKLEGSKKAVGLNVDEE